MPIPRLDQWFYRLISSMAVHPWLPRPCFQVEAVDPHATTGQKPRPGVQMWMLALPKKRWRFILQKLQKSLGNHCLDYRIIATVLDPAKIGWNSTLCSPFPSTHSSPRSLRNKQLRCSKTPATRASGMYPISEYWLPTWLTIFHLWFMELNIYIYRDIYPCKRVISEVW